MSSPSDPTIWKQFRNSEYRVSNTGLVKKGDKIADPYIGRAGYYRITLYAFVNGQEFCKNFSIHKMVAECHLGIRPDGMVVNHKDHNKLNNHVSNLEYVTSARNSNHHWKHEGHKLTSPYVGVSINPATKKYQVRIHFDKKQYWLGQFEDEELAAQAYDRASWARHKDPALLNFPHLVYQYEKELKEKEKKKSAPDTPQDSAPTEPADKAA